MKHFVLVAIMCAFFSLSFLSCGNEDEEFENIEFQTTGVQLSTSGAIYYRGEIEHTGADMTFTAVGKNADNGFISQVKVGNYLYDVTGDDSKQELPYTLCEGEWGEIEILSSSPHVTRVFICENETKYSRNLELTFGAVYKISIVSLTQLSE